MREIIVASGNDGKVREFRELLQDLPVALSSLADHFNPLPLIEENGATFFENAMIKARWVWERKRRWVLADDSGLEVDVLEGKPGVKSARFAGASAGAPDNNRKLLDLLAQVPPGRRTARFKCVIVLVTSPENRCCAEGTCEGAIVDIPRGTEGFGYDPLFQPSGFSLTFAEMAAEQKHAISHRGKAMAAVRKHLYDLLK